MKNVIKYLAIFFVLLLAMTFPIVAYANNENKGNSLAGSAAAKAKEYEENAE